MKKTLLSMMGVAIGVFAFGQTTELAKSPYKVMRANEATELTVAPASTSTNRSADGNGAEALGAVIFSETFGAGLAGDGSNGAWTTNGEVSGANDPDAVWEYRGTATTPSNAIGSRGAYSGTQDPVASPTTANGFFIFDSDYLDNDGTPGNFGNGLAPTPHKSWLISPVFSTMGSGNSLVIQLSSYFRRFAGNAYVLLSNDGGTTWGDTVIIMDTDFGVNERSSTNEIIYREVNFLANTANAQIAVYFDGETAEPSANGLGYYFVMVDDIVISEAPDNDLTIGTQYYQNDYDTGFTMYYTMIPESQAVSDQVQFSSTVKNEGKLTQPNTKLTNSIVTPSGSSTMVSNMVDLGVGNSDSLIISNMFQFNQGVGEYVWAFDISSDSTEDIPFNNYSDTARVVVTDSTFARDRNSSGTFTYTSGDPYEMGNMFEISNSVKATSISVAVGPGSTHAEVISVYLYTYDETPTDIITGLLSSQEFYLLDSATFGSIVAYDIPDVILPPGRYLATYKTYSTDVGFSQSDFTTDPLKSFVDVGGSGSFGWVPYTTPVRLNVSNDICDVVATATQTGNNTASVTATGGTLPYTYMWDNGETTAIATNLSSGVTHSVTVTDASTPNACTGDTTVDIVTSVQNIELNNAVKLFPNPNNGEFTLSLNGLNGVYTVTVRNAVGQMITTETINVSGDINKNMSNSDLSKGVYFVEVSDTAGDRTIIRFVVK